MGDIMKNNGVTTELFCNKCDNNISSTFANGTALLATNNEETATNSLQISVKNVTRWAKKLCIKLTETKSTSVNFNNRKIEHLPILVNHKIILHANFAKYLACLLYTSRCV